MHPKYKDTMLVGTQNQHDCIQTLFHYLCQVVQLQMIVVLDALQINNSNYRVKEITQ